MGFCQVCLPTTVSSDTQEMQSWGYTSDLSATGSAVSNSRHGRAFDQVIWPQKSVALGSSVLCGDNNS